VRARLRRDIVDVVVVVVVAVVDTVRARASYQCVQRLVAVQRELHGDVQDAGVAGEGRQVVHQRRAADRVLLVHQRPHRVIVTREAPTRCSVVGNTRCDDMEHMVERRVLLDRPELPEGHMQRREER
jgi:hypothetical protein